MANDAEAIRLEGVSVRIGPRLALENVSLVAPPGFVVAVVGPNGAGKSTLLRAAAGLIRAEAGSVRLCGADPAAAAPAARARLMAYLPQDKTLAWGLSVEALAALGRFSLAPDPAAVARALHACGLESLKTRRADQLSGGERARAHLARAFAAQAPVLIADEPTAALDPFHAFTVMQLLADKAAAGAAVLLATHDLTLAARFAHRIVVLKAGRILVDAPPAQALAAERLAEAFAVRAALTPDARHLHLEGPL